jgi:DNA-binding NarL/FixJ family response regulator
MPLPGPGEGRAGRGELVRVIIADDHRLMREGTAALLDTDPRIEVVGLARDGLEAIELALAQQPDVVLLDLNMPSVHGIQACAVLRNRIPDTQVLILTVSEHADDLHAALRVGAAGYLLKDMPPVDLVAAVLRTARREPTIAPSLAAQLLGSDRPPATALLESSLSPRERDVLGLLAKGHTNREIGARLGIAGPTVKTHVRHVLEKLHLRNRAEAAAFATRRGI